ncbi:MAG TPA: hypothetical protein VFV68_06100, partial [Agriterribacter sp.]|nr:hypothetical protein [Agriterribacter sp.]
LHNTFVSTIENAKGTGKLWCSQAFSWQLSNKFDVPAVSFRNYKGMPGKKYKDTQWHLKAINKTKASKVRFLSIIQVAQGGKMLPFEETANTADVTKINIGGWEIDAALSYDLPAQLQIRSSAANTAFTAYGSSIKFENQWYKGEHTESSMLVERVNGKIKFDEAVDVPVAPTR